MEGSTQTTPAEKPNLEQAPQQIPQQALEKVVPPKPKEPSPEEILRQRITTLVGMLIAKASDLAFELSTIECEKVQNCSVCLKAKEVVKVIKELRNEFSKLPQSQSA